MPEVMALPVTRDAKKATTHKSRGSQLVVVTNEPLAEKAVFLIATLSRIKDRCLQEYEQSKLATRDYYDQLKRENRLIIYDGPELFPLVQSAYRKSNILPSNVTLELVDGYLHLDKVYIGVVSAKELRRCYKEHGEALFLDNIRLFLGYSELKDRDNVNLLIMDTADKSPREMLARNNGITFRAAQVVPQGKNILSLEKASIVNGCQTTMCVVESTNDESNVLVKIVETEEAWSIAKTANSQNKVDQIVLEMAKYIRPQIVKKAAGKAGVSVRGVPDTIFDVFKAFYKDEVVYDEIYYLFLGLFSREPRNVINTNYTEVRKDLLTQLIGLQQSGEEIVQLLFKLYMASLRGMVKAQDMYQDEESRSYERFWKEDKPDYRSFLTLLAACGATEMNIYKEGASVKEVKEFLEKLDEVLANNSDKFVLYYCFAFEAVVGALGTKHASQIDRQRYMYDQLKSLPFEPVYSSMCRTAVRHFSFKT